MAVITIKDIKERYVVNKSKEKKFYWTYHIRRPVSYYLAWIFLRLGISANKVTLSFLSVGIVGCLLLITGNYLYMILGALLIELSNILDSVDGHIARFTGPKFSGHILDTWAGFIVHVSSMFSLGIGLSNSKDLVSKSMLTQFGIGNDMLIYIGFFSALVALAAWPVRIHWNSIASQFTSKNIEPDNKLRSSGVVLLIDNLFHYSGAYAPLMVISILLHLADIFLLAVAFIYSVYLIIFMVIIMKRAYSLDRQNIEKNK